MKNKIIPLDELKNRGLYFVDSKNGCVAIWKKSMNVFIQIGIDTSENKLDICHDKYYSVDDGTVKPKYLIEVVNQLKQNAFFQTIKYLEKWDRIITDIVNITR